MDRVLTRMASVLLVLTLVLPLQVAGQEDSGAGAPAVEPGSPGSPMPGGGVPEVYTVEGGDTLWDLCQRFLNNPWYWPKIWSYNPKITNPHWIYPGDEVYFYPQEGQRPAPLLGPEPLEPIEVGGAEIATVSVADVDRPVLLGPDGKPVIEVSGIHQIGAPHLVGQREYFTARRAEEFLARDVLEHSGTIEYSQEAREWLATRDEAYARFKDLSQVSVGDKFQVFTVVKEVEDPETEDDCGVLIRINGQAQVIAMNEQWATIKFTMTYNPMERGDFLRPWQELERRVKLTKNQVDLEGSVIDVWRNNELAGEHHLVFVNRGAEQGVREGNQLAVIRRGDGLIEADSDDLDTLPDEIVGEMVILEAFPDSSTAVVTRSLRAIERGDRLVMRASN